MKGNECRRLLKNLDYLDKHLPQNLDMYRVALKRFSDLEESCFGSELDPHYEDRISDFREAYVALDHPMTTKVSFLLHILGPLETLFPKLGDVNAPHPSQLHLQLHMVDISN